MMRIGLLFALLLLSVEVFAQKVIVRKRTVDGQVQTEEQIAETSVYQQDKWALKLSIASMAIGDYGLSVEYLVTDWLTIEGGAGLLSKNYISEAFFDNPYGFNNIFAAGSYCEACEYQYDRAVSTFLRVKFFPDEDGLDEGEYWAITYNNRPYNGSASTLGGSEDVDWKNTNNDIGVIYGKQWDLGASMMLEAFYGGGIRFSSIIAPYTFYDNTNNQSRTYSVEDTSFFIVLGFQLGYFF